MFLFHTFRNDHRVLKEARSLLGAGHRVTLIALRENDSYPRERTEDGIRVRRVLVRRRRFSKVRYAEYFLRASLAGLRSGADVFHCHDLDTLVPAVIASRFGRTPLVYDSHELFTETHFLRGREREKRIWSGIERGLIRFAVRVITVSQPIVEELVKRYDIKEPLLVMNRPVYHPPPAPRPLPVDLGGEPLLLCQGYLQEGRGLETLIRAMEGVRRGRLVLLGDGEEGKTLSAQVQKLGLEEKVFLLPAVPIEDLPPLTASATIGLIAYSGESLNFRYALPNKFFEYLMAGVPVLSSPLPEIVRLVKEHGVGEIVDPPTPERFAGAINALLDDPDKMAEMKSRCAEAAKTLHWGPEEEKLLALYREIAANNRN